MAMFSGNGDAPRIVIAPTNVKECHYWLAEAFYLAEKYQVPAIVLMDLFLSTCKSNIVLSEIDPAKLKANKFPTKVELEDYRRQAITDDGVSPRAIPGTPGGEHVVSGLEQNQDGTPAYDAANHEAMTAKRHRKLLTALDLDVPRPERFGCEGKAKLGVLGWGSTMGAIREAVELACDKGLPVAGLKQVVLNPLHFGEVRAFCHECEKVLVPELNYQGQFADWLGMHMDVDFVRYNKVGASPIPYNDILDEIERLLGEGS